MAENTSETVRSGEIEDELEDGLNPRESTFVRALIDGLTIDEASKLVDIVGRTGRRWRRKPAVVAALRDHARASVQQATAVLVGGATRAALSLLGIADEKRKVSASVVAASRAILEFASKGTEIAEIEERLGALEEQIANTHGTFRGKA